MSYVKFDKDVIGYKVVIHNRKKYIVTLLIPKGAMIHSGMLGNKIKATKQPYIYDDITGCKIEDGAKLSGRHDTKDGGHRLTVDGFNFTEYKCRAECAEVLQIEEFGTNKLRESVTSFFYGKGGVFIETEYSVGEMVYPNEFYIGDTDSYFIQEVPSCEEGIHFFPERWMAGDYR